MIYKNSCMPKTYHLHRIQAFSCNHCLHVIVQKVTGVGGWESKWSKSTYQWPRFILLLPKETYGGLLEILLSLLMGQLWNEELKNRYLFLHSNLGSCTQFKNCKYYKIDIKPLLIKSDKGEAAMGEKLKQVVCFALLISLNLLFPKISSNLSLFKALLNVQQEKITLYIT